MRPSTVRVILAGVISVALVAAGTPQPAFAQAPALAVTLEAENPWPTPAPVGQPVQVSLNAKAYNVPTATYPCTMQPPTWSWLMNPPAPQTPPVQYRATVNDPWGAPQGSYSLSFSMPDDAVNPPDPTVSKATLTIICQQAGYWRISPSVRLTYTDTCDNSWSAFAQATIADILAVSVTFDPSSVTIEVPGLAAPDTATVTPAEAAPLVTFDTYDHTVATVTASSSESPVPLTVTADSAGVTQLTAWLGATYCAAATVTVGNADAERKVPLGTEISVTGPGHFKVFVPTSAGGILNITTDGTLINLEYPDNMTAYTNNTETGLNQQGWYKFQVNGTPTKVKASFTQTAQAMRDNKPFRPPNFYWWTDQAPYIAEPDKDMTPNGTADSKVLAGSDDRQLIAKGATVEPSQPIITAGPNGTLESSPMGDDMLIDMKGVPTLFVTTGDYQPLVKYDKNHSGGKTTARDKQAQISDDIDASMHNHIWGGHCLGGALASVLLKLPIPNDNTGYNVEELRGLWAELGENPNQVPAPGAFGLAPAGPPKFGPDPTDAWAPGFHAVLEKEIKVSGNACFSNLGAKSDDEKHQRIGEVWNHAVYKYTAIFGEAPGGKENTVLIRCTIDANLDHPPPTDDVTDREISYAYIITYDAQGKPDSNATADWIRVGGDAYYAPASLYRVSSPSWAGNNPEVTEKNVRADDKANP